MEKPAEPVLIHAAASPAALAVPDVSAADGAAAPAPLPFQNSLNNSRRVPAKKKAAGRVNETRATNDASQACGST